MEARPLDPDFPGRRVPLTLIGEKSGAEPFSSRSLSTVLAHEATACARERGRDGEFYLEVATEYWARGTDLGSIYTLRNAAIRAGLRAHRSARRPGDCASLLHHYTRSGWGRCKQFFAVRGPPIQFSAHCTEIGPDQTGSDEWLQA